MNVSIKVPWKLVLMFEMCLPPAAVSHSVDPSTGRHVCSVFVCRCVTRAAAFVWVIHQTWTPTHLLLGLKVMVVLGHFFTGTLVDQLSAQQPHGQTGHEHPNVRQENSDTIACICTNNTTNTDSTSAHSTEAYALFFHIHFSLNRSADVQYSREHVTGDCDYNKQASVARIPVKPHAICEGGKHLWECRFFRQHFPARASHTSVVCRLICFPTQFNKIRLAPY